MIATQNYMPYYTPYYMPGYAPVARNPYLDMAVEAVRTVLPAVHTQMNQARLNSLQVRQAAINSMNQSVKASLDADRQFFELAQAVLPIAHKHSVQMHTNLLEIHEASITSMNQAMEQSMKTDQQLYEACLKLLNNEQREAVAEDMEAEVEVEVVPDEDIA